jgi:DNA-directed RNA polymerase specialized sigma24 family protein
MDRDPPHRKPAQFNHLFEVAFRPKFLDRLPQNLGSILYRMMSRDLGVRGLDEEHVEELSSRFLTETLTWVTEHGPAAIRYPSPAPWFHRVREHMTIDYLKEVARSRHSDSEMEHITRLLEGKEQDDLLTSPAGGELSDDEQMALVWAAVGRLTPREREFFELDLGQCRSPEEIQTAFGWSRLYFRKFKSLATRALRRQIEAELDRRGRR